MTGAVFGFVVTRLSGDERYGFGMRQGLSKLLAIEIVFLYTSMDIVMFVFTYEAVTWPVLAYIGMFGRGYRRWEGGMKLFMYTLVSGSSFMLVFVFNVWCQYGVTIWVLSSDMVWAGREAVSLAFLLMGVAIKIPVYPMHVWLPDAHSEASSDGSVWLAGILLKLGCYALFRLCD